MTRKSQARAQADPNKRRPYAPPELRELGHMADVVQKSGAPPDMQQSRKPGGGGG